MLLSSPQLHPCAPSPSATRLAASVLRHHRSTAKDGTAVYGCGLLARQASLTGGPTGGTPGGDHLYHLTLVVSSQRYKALSCRLLPYSWQGPLVRPCGPSHTGILNWLGLSAAIACSLFSTIQGTQLPIIAILMAGTTCTTLRSKSYRYPQLVGSVCCYARRLAG